MTYDEDDVTELDLLYDELRETKEARKYDAEMHVKRIAELTAALEEALEYFIDKYDVVDGEDGRQRSNEEMRLGTMIDETLHGIRF